MTDGSPLRILVVDDHRDSAISLALVLRMMGHAVHVAYDGLQAIEVAEKCRPDAILLDLSLPKLNGFDTAATIRELDWGKRVRIIAVSGWGEPSVRLRSRESGFDQHLVKPVDMDALVELLASVTPDRSPEEALTRGDPQSWPSP